MHHRNLQVQSRPGSRMMADLPRTAACSALHSEVAYILLLLNCRDKKVHVHQGTISCCRRQLVYRHSGLTACRKPHIIHEAKFSELNQEELSENARLQASPEWFITITARLSRASHFEMDICQRVSKATGHLNDLRCRAL